MINLLKETFTKVRFFGILYTFFLVGVCYILFSYSKHGGTILVNNSWSSAQDFFFIYITSFGGGLMALFIVGLLTLFLSIRKGIIAFCSFVFTALITQGLKHLVFSNAMRPFIELWDEFKSGELHLALSEELMKKGNSFPSGHTTSAFSVFLILTLFAKRPIYGLFFGLLAILASYSRVYLGQHFFEDIFLGSVIGVLGTLMVYFLFERKMWLKGLDISLIKYKKNVKKVI